PDHADHFFDRCRVAHIAAARMDAAASAIVQLLLGCRQNLFAPTADVDFGAKFKESLGCGFTEACAAAGNKDAFVEEKIGLEHERNCNAAARCSSFVVRRALPQSDSSEWRITPCLRRNIAFECLSPKLLQSPFRMIGDDRVRI